MILKKPNHAEPSLDSDLHINPDSNQPVIPRHVRDQLEQAEAEGVSTTSAERVEPTLNAASPVSETKQTETLAVEPTKSISAEQIQPVVETSSDEIKSVEMFVNQEILNNTDTEAKTMHLDDAKKSGAMMLFGEKYADEVRVLSIGSSKELCGGTHVRSTAEIGTVAVTKIEKKSRTNRRVVVQFA